MRFWGRKVSCEVGSRLGLLVSSSKETAGDGGNVSG